MKKKSWALILGASSGIGKACALALCKQKMNIMGIHLDIAEREDEINEFVNELKAFGGEVIFYNINADSKKARAETISEIKVITESTGGIQVFLHSLAFGTLLPFIPARPDQEYITKRHMEMTLSVMAHSFVYWVQELFLNNLLQAGSKIFALTSMGSVMVSGNYGAVSAAKCALESHVRQLAFELAPHEISVNAIRAGITITPSLLKIPEHEELIQRARAYNPHRRLTTPKDIAAAIALLIKDGSSWLTGNIINVDGGEMLSL